MTETALICAFDTRFARSFQVMVESLRASPRLFGLDRIVITTDPAVRDDPAIRALATRIRFVAAEELAAFQDVRRDNIPKDLLSEALPKYSMLKWFGFDDYGYDKALYLDTDLINVTNADEILDLLDSADLVGGPVFPRELRTENKKHLAIAETDARIRQFCDGEGDWPRRLNSGVLLFNRRFMGTAVREGLIALATGESVRNDQSALRSWLKIEKNVTHKLISPYFNFNAGFLGRCHPHAWPHHLARIKFLHYVGRQNPWELSSREMRWYHRLWRDIERLTPGGRAKKSGFRNAVRQ